MEADEYTRLARHESRLWWFKQLHSNIFALFDRFNIDSRDGRVIDLGSGTGALIGKLHARYPNWAVTGLDISLPASTYATETHGNLFLVGDVNNLPFRNNCADLILSADVLCHRQVTPEKMLSEIQRVLKPGGLLILNNPAYDWLFSYHDRFVHTARRYTRGRIVRELQQAGYTCVYVTYWNTTLFPLMVVVRKFFGRKASKSDVRDLRSALNALFSRLTSWEASILRRGIVLPFGGSVLAVAQRR